MGLLDLLNILNKKQDDDKKQDKHILFNFEKEEIRRGNYDPWNFEEEDLEDDDYYKEDDI